MNDVKYTMQNVLTIVLVLAFALFMYFVSSLDLSSIKRA